jgi:hypothetical protein
MRGLPTGANWIAGGGAAAILLPVLAIGLGLPFWIAALASMLAGGGIVTLLTAPQPFAHLTASGVAGGKIELAGELLEEADPLVDRMATAAKASAHRRSPSASAIW